MSVTLQDQHLPGVLSVMSPLSATVPLVFDSPHSGVQLPSEFQPAVSTGWVLRSGDLHIDDLFGFVPALGAALLIAHFPRSFMDVNRSLLDVDIRLLDAPWPHPVRDSASTKRGMGLVWRYAWEDRPMYDRLLRVSELTQRIDRYWHPYHRQLKHLLDHAHARHGCVYHVNCHSMPAYGHALSPDPPGTTRPEFVIGDFDGTTCEAAFVELIVETLRDLDYSVAVNEPFRGAELITAYSAPTQRRHSVQIEINRKLYMNEQTRERTGGYDTLRRNLQVLAEKIRSYVISSTANLGDGHRVETAR